MGIDLFTHCEARRERKWTFISTDLFYDTRHYGLFGFLADIRNISKAPPLAQPRGLPIDITEMTRSAYETQNDSNTCFAASYVYLKELRDFDYDACFEDRRTIIDVNYGATAKVVRELSLFTAPF